MKFKLIESKGALNYEYFLLYNRIQPTELNCKNVSDMEKIFRRLPLESRNGACRDGRKTRVSNLKLVCNPHGFVFVNGESSNVFAAVL